MTNEIVFEQLLASLAGGMSNIIGAESTRLIIGRIYHEDKFWEMMNRAVGQIQSVRNSGGDVADAAGPTLAGFISENTKLN
jgi:hypothetical protein